MILAGICAEFFWVKGHQLDWRFFLIVLGVSTFISGAVASLFFYPVRDAGHVAAWAQAIGTLAAVWVAVYVFNREQSATRIKEHRNAEIDFLMEQFDLWTLSNAIYGLKNSISLSLNELDAVNINEDAIKLHKVNAKINLNSIIDKSKGLSWRSFVVHDENLRETVGNIIRRNKILLTLRKNLKYSSDYYFNLNDLSNVAELEADVTKLVGHVDRSLNG